MTPDVEIAVVGGGVVGLAVARELAATGRDVLVIEQHDRVGTETSSRNSEVIHAGLYYEPGSLKARLCVEGKALLYDFATDSGVPTKRLGKILVATSASEIAKLERIAANAQASGVSDLKKLSPADMRVLEPDLTCVAAYLSPSTGIIDSHALMTAFEGHIQSHGGTVVLKTRVSTIEQLQGAYAISTRVQDGTTNRLTCHKLVIAAGLHSSALAAMLFQNGPGEHSSGPAYTPPITTYAKGHYFSLEGRAPFSHLIYPMPTDGGLGVHLTLDIAGAAKFGPDVTWIDDLSYTFDDPEGARRAQFDREIRRWWPGLPAGALVQGYTGIRPKLSRAGEPAADFAIHGPKHHGLDGFVSLFGIESPGLTASLAIARHVAAQLL